MRNDRCSSPLQVDRPIVIVDSNQVAGTLLSSRIADLKCAINCVVLRRKPITMDHRTLDPACFAHVFEPAQRSLVLLEFVIRKLTKPEVFPPSRFLFSSVPFQHLSKQPSCSLFLGPRGLVIGKV